MTASIKVDPDPNGIAVDPSSHNVYVSSADYQRMSVIDESGDARSGQRIATVDTGSEEKAVTVDPYTHAVYVLGSPGEGLGCVTMIDESGDAGSGTVAGTDIGPYYRNCQGLAEDPYTHDVYVLDGLNRVVIEGPPADVAFTVTGPGVAPSRATFTVTVTVTNHGPAAAFGIGTDLMVPSGISPRSFPGATFAGGVLRWSDPMLASGATITHAVISAVATNLVKRTLMGGVAISSTAFDPDPGNNAAFTQITYGYQGAPPPGSEP